VDFPRQGLLGRFPRLDLAAGKLPRQRKGLVGPALREQDPAPSFDEGRHHEKEPLAAP
jgi:hypothetical protein